MFWIFNFSSLQSHIIDGEVFEGLADPCGAIQNDDGESHRRYLASTARVPWCAMYKCKMCRTRWAVQDDLVNGWALAQNFSLQLPGRTNVDQHGTSTFQRVGTAEHWFVSSDSLLFEEDLFSTFFNSRTSKSMGRRIGMFDKNDTKTHRQQKGFPSWKCKGCKGWMANSAISLGVFFP